MMLNFVGGKWQWQEWQNEASTHLVFIGWNVVKDDILEKLNACMVTT
ncbi:MAG: GTP-binding protein [Desulfotignum sp.]|nr:GTP-binding protein [Desulfotignum sp.]